MRSLRLLLVCLALPLGLRAASWWDDAWMDPALLEAHSLEGGSGFIHVPAPSTLPNGLLTGGIHRYRVKGGRGFPYGIEAGLQVELEGWKQDEVEKRSLYYFRWAPLTPQRNGVGFAVGVENLGLEDLGLKALTFLPLKDLESLDRVYAVLGGPVPHLPMFYWAGGYGGGSQRIPGGFGALAFAPFAGIAFMTELEDYSAHVGVRMLLSTQIKLDLSLSRVEQIDPHEPFARVLDQNLRFGISYSEKWP